MRKFLITSFILLLLIFQTTGTAFAFEPAYAKIAVTIEGGGKAYMITEVNCPLPVESVIRVDNGRTGHFHIDFTETGEYHYLIKAGFSTEDGEREANEVFRLTVTVHERDDGSLFTSSVINSRNTTEKLEQIHFQKTSATTTQPSKATTQPSEATTRPPQTPSNPDNPDSPNKPGTPRTGDESHLSAYVLVVIAASAGLFFLALLYTINTNKLIRED